MPPRISFVLLSTCLCLLILSSPCGAQTPIALNLADYDRACGIEIEQQDSLIKVRWPYEDDHQGQITFDLSPGQPLVRQIAVSHHGEPLQPIASGLDPMLRLRVGRRDLDKRGGWTIFFDRMQNKPSEVFDAALQVSTATAESNAKRMTLTIGDLAAGPFDGRLRWTFYAGSAFVLQEAVMRTERKATAYLYDTGLVCRDAKPESLAWRDSQGPIRQEQASSISAARHVAVHGRAVAAEFGHGSIALFPPPHRYFYPLDFSDNLSNIWVGPGYGDRESPFGFGVRHDPSGDNRFVPWFNAPVGTPQEMGLFLMLSDQSAEQTLGQVSRLTRDDRFARIEGHTVFSSHYHVEHTRELLEAQKQPQQSDDQLGQAPVGRQYRIPPRLQDPGFVRTFRELGIDIVHLGEFHFGRTPRMNTQERLEHLGVLHAECRRLSDEEFLLLPGEEPNVHLGGHWISFFPTPVYWVLNRPEGTPFVSDDPELGKVYHVGSQADVLRLLRAEQGLAWTAHPRIKGSTGYPDGYRDQLFFQSDRFLGAAWKAMPADLSKPKLGSRVLDLLDDMSNWGDPKYVLGEVDVFKIEPDHELYAHMNVNYLRLDKIPSFDDGWQPVLDALREGRFFVTSGEVLIPEFTVNGQRSGETARVTGDGTAQLRLDLRWTFPLAYAEVITGDGQATKRQRIDLTSTDAFDEQSLTIDVDVKGQRWLRVEVWDIATNGAFTQPVWLNAR